MGTHPIFESDFDCLTDKMEERHTFDCYELIVQLVPETGENNFQYVIKDASCNEAIAIDCYDAEKALAAIGSAQLVASLATHHHWDHIGGIPRLKTAFPNSSIVSGDERVEGCTELITGDSVIKVGTLDVAVYQTPCHTTGSVCYHLPQLNALFTGDTFFHGGVGRFFEGTAEQMAAAVVKVRRLPDLTQIYPGHEYSVANLTFAAHYEPDNEKAKQCLAECKEKRALNKFTIPATIADQQLVNPFFRFDTESIMAITKAVTHCESMRIVREVKNGFRG